MAKKTVKKAKVSGRKTTAGRDPVKKAKVRTVKKLGGKK